MKKQNTRALFAGLASTAICLMLSAFTSPRGGYGYTIHVNSKLAGEYYLTSTHQTPTLTISDADMKGIVGVYFNECKLSLRSADQKILKEWSFANSIEKHDAMEFAIKDASSVLASGKVGLYYVSERVGKPQLLAHLTTTANASKAKATSR
jgi:hypothetical protein